LPFVIRVAFIIFCLLLNIFGVQVVEKATIVFGIIVLAPFYVMFAMGAKEIDPHDWTILPPSISGVNWGVFISVVLWNTSGKFCTRYLLFGCSAILSTEPRFLSLTFKIS
jgi:amino acid transporter